MDNFRINDSVTLNGTVSYVYSDGREIQIDIGGTIITIPADLITLNKRAFIAGDHVMTSGGSQGHILMIDGDYAWIKIDSASFETVDTEDLMLVPSEAEIWNDSIIFEPETPPAPPEMLPVIRDDPDFVDPSEKPQKATRGTPWGAANGEDLQ